jgi:L-rhamnose isomerase
LEAVAGIPGVRGVDMGFPFSVHGIADDVHKTGDLVRSYGLQIATVMGVNWAGAEWKFGSLTSPDPAIRRQTVALLQQAMEAAEALGADSASLWLAHDGFDYVLQVNYARHWDMLVDGLRQITAHRPNVKVAIEYKNKDPRHFCHVSSVAACLMLIDEVGAPNLGVLQDVGHSLIARENMAESAVLAMRRGRLFHTHWNENYRSEDVDMMCGAVHQWETIECLYWLDQMGYDGWYGFDVISKREDPVRHITESVAIIQQMREIARSLDSALLDRAQQEQDAVTALQHLRQTALR